MRAFIRAIGLGMVLFVLAGCAANVKKDDSNKTTDELFEEFEKWSAEFHKRKKYTELKPEILAAIPDEKLVQAVCDFVDMSIDDSENAARKVPTLGPGFSAVYFLGSMDAQVNNGGFNQFFYNEGRKAVELSKEGAALTGLKGLAAVIGKALEIEEKEREKMAKVKEQGTVEALFESYEDISFDEADEAFQKLALDLGKVMVAFIRRRPDLFVGKVQ